MIAFSPDYFRAEGERRKLRGMDAAAARKGWLIAKGQAALIRAMLASPDRSATTDEATSDLDRMYPDHGKWRGTVTRGLAVAGYIIKTGECRRSIRPSRHAGLVQVWQAAKSDPEMEAKLSELEDWLRINRPPESILFDPSPPPSASGNPSGSAPTDRPADGSPATTELRQSVDGEDAGT
jgi:hypothetical protein